MKPLDYIREFRNFRNRFTEETGITDEQVIVTHWQIFMRLNASRPYPTPQYTGAGYKVPDVSYVPQWPDRYDPDDEDEDGSIGELIP